MSSSILFSTQQEQEHVFLYTCNPPFISCFQHQKKWITLFGLLRSHRIYLHVSLTKSNVVRGIVEEEKLIFEDRARIYIYELWNNLRNKIIIIVKYIKYLCVRWLKIEKGCVIKKEIQELNCVLTSIHNCMCVCSYILHGLSWTWPGFIWLLTREFVD